MGHDFPYSPIMTISVIYRIALPIMQVLSAQRAFPLPSFSQLSSHTQRLLLQILVHALRTSSPALAPVQACRCADQESHAGCVHSWRV